MPSDNLFANNVSNQDNEPNYQGSQPKRSTASRFGEVFGGLLGNAFSFILPGLLPAGSFFRNRGISGAINGTVGSTAITDSAPDIQAMLNNTVTQSMQMLGIQTTVQNQNQLFSMFSNLLKLRHDSAMAAVQNMKA